MARTVGQPVILYIDLVSILVGLYGIYAIMGLQLPPHLEKGGHWQFLTNLSLVYSIVIFVVGFLSHLTQLTRLFSIKNNLHPIGLALEVIVAGVYWPLRLFFIHMISKEPGKYRIPIHVDLAIHLMPVLSLLIDYFIFMPKWSLTALHALVFCAALTTGYWFLLKKLVDVESGAEYPYPFLNVDNDLLRIKIFAVVGFVAFAQFLFMKHLYGWIVKTADEEVERTKKEKKEN